MKRASYGARSWCRCWKSHAEFVPVAHPKRAALIPYGCPKGPDSADKPKVIKVQCDPAV